MSIYNMIASIVGGGGSNARLLYSGSVTVPSTYDTSRHYADGITSTESCVDKIIYFKAVNTSLQNTSHGFIKTEQIFFPTQDGSYSADPHLFKAWYKDDTNGDYGWMWSRSGNDSNGQGLYLDTFIGAGSSMYLYYQYNGGGWWIDGDWEWEIYEIDMDSASGSGGGGGGGGSAKNVQTNQTTSRISSTTLTSVNSLTCSTAGTYDVYWTCSRSSTSGTWSSQLYVNGTASGSEQTTWSNHVQTVHLTGVTIGANQTVAVYVKARGTNYYGYCPQLTIVQTS